jgi:hypothetical protein
MPRRRWVDWASCILRTAIGTGYLFEMNFYYQLVLALNSESTVEEAAAKVLRKSTPFLPWNEAESVSSRDVSSNIKKACERGVSCRSLIEAWVKEDATFPRPSNFLSTKDGLELWLHEARTWIAKEDKEHRETKIRKAISVAANTSSSNMNETVAYTLLDRSGTAAVKDLYSLLRKRGSRYTIVEPGLEWFVVIATMIKINPGKRRRVGDVMKALECLGVRSGYNTIVKELERVGLARSSHDADDAIQVVAAF